jgi:hypothetical protein
VITTVITLVTTVVPTLVVTLVSTVVMTCVPTLVPTNSRVFPLNSPREKYRRKTAIILKILSF